STPRPSLGSDFFGVTTKRSPPPRKLELTTCVSAEGETIGPSSTPPGAKSRSIGLTDRKQGKERAHEQRRRVRACIPGGRLRLPESRGAGSLPGAEGREQNPQQGDY